MLEDFIYKAIQPVITSFSREQLIDFVTEGMLDKYQEIHELSSLRADN